MQEIFDVVKMVFTNMRAIGWEPWPIIFASASAILVRGYFEDDVIAVNTVESKRRQGRVKGLAFLVSYLVSVLACYGFDYPKTKQEHIQVLLFSVLDSGLGVVSYTLYMIVDPVGRFRDRYERKAANNATTTPAP